MISLANMEQSAKYDCEPHHRDRIASFMHQSGHSAYHISAMHFTHFATVQSICCPQAHLTSMASLLTMSKGQSALVMLKHRQLFCR